MTERPLPVLADSTVFATADADTACQLERMPESTSRLGARDALTYRLRRYGRLFLLKAGKVIADPSIVYRKVARRLLRTPETPVTRRAGAIPVRGGMAPPLQAGELVRVRTLDEIAATLDADGKCGGMAYLGVVMNRYAGGTFRVRRRIDFFFDERNWAMRKLRDAVILEGAYCEPPIEAGVLWAGCGRSCFLFWKDDWLERVKPAPSHT